MTATWPLTSLREPYRFSEEAKGLTRVLTLGRYAEFPNCKSALAMATNRIGLNRAISGQPGAAGPFAEAIFPSRKANFLCFGGRMW